MNVPKTHFWEILLIAAIYLIIELMTSHWLLPIPKWFLQIIWELPYLISTLNHHTFHKTVLNWWDSELIKANIKIAFTLSGLFSCAHNFELLFFSHIINKFNQISLFYAQAKWGSTTSQIIDLKGFIRSHIQQTRTTKIREKTHTYNDSFSDFSLHPTFHFKHKICLLAPIIFSLRIVPFYHQLPG